MQGAAPPAGATIREVTQRVDGVGHVARVCGLCMESEEALAAPKWRRDVIAITLGVSSLF